MAVPRLFQLNHTLFSRNRDSGGDLAPDAVENHTRFFAISVGGDHRAEGAQPDHARYGDGSELQIAALESPDQNDQQQNRKIDEMLAGAFRPQRVRKIRVQLRNHDCDRNEKGNGPK